MKYRIKVNAPEYQVGYGPDDEFIVVAFMYSKVRAEQIARLLNQDDDAAITAMVKRESDHINSSCTYW